MSSRISSRTAGSITTGSRKRESAVHHAMHDRPQLRRRSVERIEWDTPLIVVDDVELQALGARVDDEDQAHARVSRARSSHGSRADPPRAHARMRARANGCPRALAAGDLPPRRAGEADR